MKNSCFRDFLLHFRDFTLRFVILITRICILILGAVLFSSILDEIFCIECSGFGSTDLPSILLGFVLLLPFKLLKKLSYLWFYFAILVGVIISYLSVRVEYFLLDIHILVLLLVNTSTVFQHIISTTDKKRFNPFFKKKEFVPIALAYLLVFSFFFIDVHETKSGIEYFSTNRLASSLPIKISTRDGGEWQPTKHWVTPMFTQDGFKELAQIDSGIISSNYDALNLLLTIKPDNHGDIELYENDLKIMHIPYDSNGLGPVATTKAHSPSDIFVDFTYVFFKNGYWGGDTRTYSQDTTLQITIIKSINYPERVWRLLPFEQQTLPWKLAIVQNGKKIEVVDGLKILYK